MLKSSLRLLCVAFFVGVGVLNLMVSPFGVQQAQGSGDCGGDEPCCEEGEAQCVSGDWECP